MLVCIKCDIEYQEGKEFCSRCGSPLVTREKPTSSSMGEDETQGKEQEGKLICPDCKLLYEKMTVCIRCGSDLVKEIPTQHEEPKPSHAAEVKKEELKAEPGATRWVKDEGFEAAYSSDIKKQSPKPTYSPEAKKESPQVQTPQKRPVKKLPEDTETGKRVSSPVKGKKKVLRLSYEVLTIAFLVAVGIFLLWSIYSHFIAKGPISSPSRSEEATGPMSLNASSPTQQTSTVGEPQAEEQPAQSSPTDESQEIEAIKNLFEKIRQANLEKKIDLFMSCYSTDFKDCEGKKRTTLESWENFNYLDLSFDMKKHSIFTDTATARVEWLMKISSKMGGQPQLSKTVLDVTFKKEKEGWKIKETRPVS
jgi:ketosteroid isomerase-like protein